MSYPNLVIESTYGQWLPVSADALEDDPAVVESLLAMAGARLRDWCAEHHLRVVSDIAHHVGGNSWTYPPQSVLLAECRAQGMPPADKPRRRWFRR